MYKFCDQKGLRETMDLYEANYFPLNSPPQPKSIYVQRDIRGSPATHFLCEKRYITHPNRFFSITWCVAMRRVSSSAGTHVNLYIMYI